MQDPARGDVIPAAWDSIGSAPTSPPAPQGPVSAGSPSDLLAQVRRHIQNNRYTEAEAIITSNAYLVHLVDEFGNTLLTIASQNNRKRFVKLFLRHGADINAQNGQGNAPLHYCSAYNFTEVADYLIKKGANPKVRNHSQALPSQMSQASLSLNSKMFSSSDPIPSGIQPHAAVVQTRLPSSPVLSPVGAPASIKNRPPPSAQSSLHRPTLSSSQAYLSAQAPEQQVSRSRPSTSQAAQPQQYAQAATINSTSSRPAGSTKCVISRAPGACSTGLITRTSVPIFHGINQEAAFLPSENAPAAARPVQYPSYNMDAAQFAEHKATESARWGGQNQISNRPPPSGRPAPTQPVASRANE